MRAAREIWCLCLSVFLFTRPSVARAATVEIMTFDIFQPRVPSESLTNDECVVVPAQRHSQVQWLLRKDRAGELAGFTSRRRNCHGQFVTNQNESRDAPGSEPKRGDSAGAATDTETDTVSLDGRCVIHQMAFGTLRFPQTKRVRETPTSWIASTRNHPLYTKNKILRLLSIFLCKKKLKTFGTKYIWKLCLLFILCLRTEESNPNTRKKIEV